MKVDKAVCTSPPFAAQRQLGGGGDEESSEAAMVVESNQERRCRIDAKSKCMDKTERYGVVLSTLIENKMQEIKRQSADKAEAKMKRQQQQQSPARMASKFISSCVRRNSLPDKNKGQFNETDGDVEMGLIGVDGLVVEDSLREQVDSPEQSQYMENELTSSQTKHQSDTLCDNTSLQSVNSIGTAFSIPIVPTNKFVSDARLRVLEAKSVSAQASPILPPKSLPQQNATENLTKVHTEHCQPQAKSLVPISISHRSSALAPTTSSSSTHGGFISSFNELASSNNLSNLMNINLPVISSTISHHAKRKIISTSPKPPTDRQRPTESATLEYEQRTDRKWPYANANEMLPSGVSVTADSSSVGSGRQEWKTSRRKFRKYCKQI